MGGKRVETGRFAIAPNVRFRELGGESVLLDLESGRYFGLDEVATRMWSLLTEHGDLSLLESILVEEFEVEAARLRQDLERFVGDLEAERLVIRLPVEDAEPAI